MRKNDSLAESIARLPESERAAAIASLSDEEAAALLYDWDFWARDKQKPPPGEWYVWLILAGRGFGKTRTGAEWIRWGVETGQCGHIALVAENAADARDVMVEGVGGILQNCPPNNYPKYEPSKRKLTWPNGAQAHTYSGDDPDQLRGPQHDWAWGDEPAKWRYAQDAWDNLEFGLRVGNDPRICATTTPRNTPLIKQLMADRKTHVTRGSTFENAANLAGRTIERLREKYEGTRLGRQELYAELLTDVEGALWSQELIDQHRVKSAPELVRVVVAIDPSVTSGEDADETGICVAGVDANKHGYILADLSCRDTPHGWASKAIAAYHRFAADRIVAEANNGGDLVETVIRSIDPTVAYGKVHASRGKRPRAEPIQAFYEQARAHHVGTMAGVEDEMCSYVPGVTTKSPSRMDALVWALTELMLMNRKPFLGLATSVERDL